MDFNSSFAYHKFLNDFYNEFSIKYLNDVIDFMEEDEDHTFDQYLIEAELTREIESAFFSMVVTSITTELSLISLDSTDIENKNGTEDKVYDDVVIMIKRKLQDFILDSQAYHHLAERIM
ncbi:hypothetical protein [Paenibacillus macquariensis]|uniref:Uncharacterized protein n=1 Tax=Paenibacillus macquariensis TaxID=948756 RepID=A0ABY1JKC3_9BACL|nr:hypothetical protein [Paenibacillus macquariensis]MEC0089895.1 hypothetical protein [Paenibacillus macquariensis]OAB30644.1 hypothetical protein PMSM_21065 [Paenibacillus macquariensis subsp. macquariensis]SIQ33806.1 hypothetical protein SAMN05421578_101281 [Paenibacillus macquariensis]